MPTETHYIVRNKDTGLYLTPEGNWSTKPTEAVCFPTRERAEAECAGGEDVLMATVEPTITIEPVGAYAVVRLDDPKVGAGPGTVIGLHAGPINDVRALYQGRHGVIEEGLRFWRCQAGDPVRVGDRAEMLPLEPQPTEPEVKPQPTEPEAKPWLRTWPGYLKDRDEVRRFATWHARHVVESWEEAPQKARAFICIHDVEITEAELTADYREMLGGETMYEAAKAFLAGPDVLDPIPPEDLKEVEIDSEPLKEALKEAGSPFEVLNITAVVKKDEP